MKYWEARVVGPLKAISPTTGKIIEVYPQKDARISSDLDLEWSRLSGTLSWWYQLRDVAEMHLREMSHIEHNTFEDLDAEIRTRIRTTSPKMTETAIKKAINRHPKMRKAYRARMDAQDMHQRLASQAKAIEQKSHCLNGLTKTSQSERFTKDHV